MNNNIRGLLLVITGMLFFVVQDTLIKLTVDDFSLLQVLVFRASVGTIILICYLLYKKQKIVFSSAYPFIAIFRGFFFFLGFLLFFISISKISLAEATSLFFVSPIFITIFSYFILRTQIGFQRIFAILIGFVGVLLIVKPSFTNLNIYMLFPIFTSMTYAASMVLAKKTSKDDSLFQQTFHIYIGAFIGGILISTLIYYSKTNFIILDNLNNPWIINDLTSIGMILIISVLGSFGIISLIAAYRLGNILINSPSEYLYLLFSVSIGYIIFNEMPDFYSFIGIFLIVTSGLYIIYRENKRNDYVVTETTLRS